ncbi:MAG TPA: LuxR C-terminal-related transcriptional regulator [Acidimicrobiales bacterium]|nr:LuxR C-terminal-related transcriptional regulator [Acidimicrobiales bacterium]
MPTSMEDRDVDALMRTVAELAAVRPVEQLRHDTVSLITGLIRSNLVAWNEVDLTTGTLEGVMLPDREFSGGREAWAAHVGSHPVISFYEATRDGRPYTISDFLDEDEYHQTGIYQHFYRHLGAEDQLSFVLPHPELVVGIALNREKRDFSTRDRQVANLLRPVLVQAYRNAVAHDRSQLLLEHLNSRLEADGEGLVVCDRHGRVLERTPGAEGLVARWFGPTDRSALPAIVVDWLGNRREPGPPWPLIIERDGTRLVVRRLPSREGAGTALLMSETPTGRAREALVHVGLTRRQAEVVAVMAEGASNASIANSLGISFRTVDKHLQRAFDKLGVENRTAAANLVRQLERQG